VTTPELEGSAPAGGFCPTQWSVVLEARRDSRHRREALERLCRTYWLPVYGYLRRRGHAAPDAEDLTQGFFAHLLGSDFLERPDPARGRFRGYLIGALRHYLGSHFEHENAQRRGGRAQFLDWSELDAETEFAALDQPQRDPSEVYETGWALALVGRAMERLAAEQGTPAKARQFAVLRPFLSTAAASGGYEQAALALGTTRTNVAVWVHRLNHRYGELVKLEVAATVQNPAEVKHEMQHLLQALRR